MSTPEFSRVVDLRQCDGREIELVANQQERAALAERFEREALPYRAALLCSARRLTRRDVDAENRKSVV